MYRNFEIMLTFISDLDRTLVYSKQTDGVCVEFDGKREISFMTNQAHKIFLGLQKRNDFRFIPCTARSRELAMRISFIQEKEPKFMICDHGGSIYVDGILDETWSQYLTAQEIIDPGYVSRICELTESYLQLHKVPFRKITNNRHLFFVISFTSTEEAEAIYPVLQKKFDTKKLRFYRQGRKIYYLPVKLDKSLAVEYIKDIYGIQNIVTSGDSFFDKSFTALGEAIFLPAHADFHHPQAIRSKKYGMDAGEELVLFLKKTFVGINQK